MDASLSSGDFAFLVAPAFLIFGFASTISEGHIREWSWSSTELDRMDPEVLLELGEVGAVAAS